MQEESNETQLSCEQCGEIFVIPDDPNAKVGEEEKRVCPSCGNSDGSKMLIYF